MPFLYLVLYFPEIHSVFKISYASPGESLFLSYDVVPANERSVYSMCVYVYLFICICMNSCLYILSGELCSSFIRKIDESHVHFNKGFFSETKVLKYRSKKIENINFISSISKKI